MSNRDTANPDPLLGEFQALVRDFRAHLSALSESLPADWIPADEEWLNQRREQYRRAASELTLEAPADPSVDSLPPTLASRAAAPSAEQSPVPVVPAVTRPVAANTTASVLSLGEARSASYDSQPAVASPATSPEPAARVNPPTAAQLQHSAAPERQRSAAATPASSAPVISAPAVPAPASSVPVIPAPPVPAPATAAPAVGARSALITPLSPPTRRALDVEPSVRLAQLRDEVRDCKLCGLCESRTQTVFSRGTGSSGVVFVGEGPGADEDAQGEPFVGKAGQLLDRMIAAMGLDRDAVYVCNIVKCRPPDNRKPEDPEMAACRPYLLEQLDLVQPRVIVALGATAVQGLLGLTMGITRMRGQWRLYQGRIPVMPTFHPAYLLRQPSAKREVWQDLQAVLEQVGLKAPARSE